MNITLSTTSSKIITLPVLTDSLESYLQMIKQYPLLSEEEEHELAIAYHEKKNIEAAGKLVLAHLRFVAKIAKSYLGYGLPYADLIQEGNIGLMKAVQRFDPSVGVRLVTFAVHWIKAEIHEFVIRNWRMVKIASTKGQRKLFFKLRQILRQMRDSKNSLSWLSEQEISSIAKKLNVTHKDIKNMEARLPATDLSFETSISNENSNEHYIIPANYLEDSNANPALMLEFENTTDHLQNNLKEALKSLDERSRYILMQRWLNEKKATLSELAKYFQVSAERIRQLEKNAMEKVKIALLQTS